MMGGDKHVAAWAARRRAKALHIGTYEAAVHNMLRRIRDQADRGNQFYLYRVHLSLCFYLARSVFVPGGLARQSTERGAVSRRRPFQFSEYLTPGTKRPLR